MWKDKRGFRGHQLDLGLWLCLMFVPSSNDRENDAENSPRQHRLGRERLRLLARNLQFLLVPLSVLAEDAALTGTFATLVIGKGAAASARRALDQLIHAPVDSVIGPTRHSAHAVARRTITLAELA